MDVSTDAGFRQRPGWLIVVAVLLVVQGWLTLRLFSPDYSFDHLMDDQPVVSGRHALHFYHGMLGAKSWMAKGSSCCFDPAYQAGYPKTPVFDGGSRPAEFFQLMGGLRPVSYKIGLAIGCLLAPFAFVAMGRGIGLTAGASCLCGLLGQLIWWSEPCYALLVAGDVDLLYGGLCVLLHVTWFVRFERHPGIESWTMMTLFATLAWYTQPLLVIGFLPFLLLYYLWVATQQGPIWHLAIAAAAVLSFGLNAGWLIEWTRYLWLYLPTDGQLPQPAPFWPTVAAQWTKLIPNDPFVVGIAAVGLVGLLMMLKTNRPAAWLLGVGTLKYVAASSAGKFWPVLNEFGAEKLLLIAAWALTMPCALVLTNVAVRLGRACGWRPLGAMLLIVALAGLAWGVGLPNQVLGRPPLEIGLNKDREKTVKALIEQTTPDARILWEDRTGSGQGWTALLALLTERSFLGGLDPDGRVEHMYARLQDGSLTGRPLQELTTSQLLQFCERFNVGWVVCWTPESIERFRGYHFARPMAALKDGSDGVLFAIERKPSYFLKGSGQWVLADTQRIALADLMPENGEIILSMHYQSNMRVSPGYVQIEHSLDLNDPIPFIRLRLPGPVSRLSIVWETP
jgi:hypothetical protein